MRRLPVRKSNRYKRKTKIIHRGTKKYLTKIVLAAIVILVSIVFLGFIFLNKFLNQNFASALSPSDRSILTDNLPAISYIVVNDLRSDPIVPYKVQYIVLDKDDQKLMIYDVPLTLKFDVPGKFGIEEFSKIFALGGLNSNDPLKSGMAIIDTSLFRLFGFKVDKYVIADRSLESTLDDFWQSGAGFSMFSMLDPKTNAKYKNSLRTDLERKEFNNIKSFIQSLTSDRVVEKTLDNASFDDPSKIDDDIKDLTFDSQIAKENKNIAVLNGTDSGGLALFGARVVENAGGRIVAIHNCSRFYDQSYIIADDKNTATVAYLARVFNIKNILTKSEALSFNENEISRSDVILILGFDTAGDLY
jgi:hypothetical protein